MKIKVGDKVRLKSWKEIRKICTIPHTYAYLSGFNGEMEHYCNKIVTVETYTEEMVDDDNGPSDKIHKYIYIVEDGGEESGYEWSIDMIAEDELSIVLNSIRKELGLAVD